MGADVKRWVRLGTAVTLGAPQLAIGVWAVAAPKNWFESFPGFDPRLVAAAPPYNEHLASDVGAGFLATGVVLLVAALSANRVALRTALLAFVVFTVPHVLYHATNPADALSSIENAANTLMLANGLVLAAVFAWGLRVADRTVAHPSGVASNAGVGDSMRRASPGIERRNLMVAAGRALEAHSPMDNEDTT